MTLECDVSCDVCQTGRHTEGGRGAQSLGPFEPGPLPSASCDGREISRGEVKRAGCANGCRAVEYRHAAFRPRRTSSTPSRPAARQGAGSVAGSATTTPRARTPRSAAGRPTRSMLSTASRKNWRRNQTGIHLGQAAKLSRKADPPLSVVFQPTLW